MNMHFAMEIEIRIRKHLCINICSNLLTYVHISDMTLCVQMSKIFFFILWQDDLYVMILQQWIFYYRGLLNRVSIWSDGLIVSRISIYDRFFLGKMTHKNCWDKSWYRIKFARSRPVYYFIFRQFSGATNQDCYYCCFQHLGAHFLHWNQNPKFWVTWHISETETN